MHDASVLLLQALVEFLDNGDEIRFEIIEAWLPKLKAILCWFEHQTLFHFYSSSILLIYDAKGSGTSCLRSGWGPLFLCSRRPRPASDVRLVDFAHAEPALTLDENYLFGLRTLLEMLEGIANEGRTATHIYENQRFHSNRPPTPPPTFCSLRAAHLSALALPFSQTPHGLAPIQCRGSSEHGAASVVGCQGKSPHSPALPHWLDNRAPPWG